jgi:outer membrane protein insertion porin family
MRRVLTAALAVLLVCVSGVVVAQATDLVSEVRVEGNRRVDSASIRVHIDIDQGDLVDRGAIDEDIKSIYAMGFFDNIYVTLLERDGAMIVTYLVEERPYVTDVVFEGNESVKAEDLEAVINITARTIFDPRRVVTGLEAARKLYTSEGYPDAKIDFEVEVDADNSATIVYSVEEGDLIRVGEIEFEGVDAFTDRELRKLMTTRTEWMFSFLTGAGLLNEDELATDVERVTAHYYDHGYLQARVDEPKVERDGDALRVRIKVEEGPLFRVGALEFTGDVLMEEDELKQRLLLKQGDVFRASQLRESIFSLTEAYGNLGYAFADVVPDTRIDAENDEMDVRFNFDAGEIVTIRRIEVRGNTKTRDEVVRRELGLDEGAKFSGTGLQSSKRAVRRLGFFDEVELSTERTENADEVDLVVDVEEGRTGAFSAGAGFSSADSFLFNARVSEQNLFGRGQRLVLNADLGSVRQNFRLAFTEPWFRDLPLSVGFDLFSWQLEFDRFTRGGTGIALRSSYPLRRLGFASFLGFPLYRVRAGLEYKLESTVIDGLDVFAPEDVWAEERTQLTSSVTPSIFRNTLDHPFDPNTGSRQSLSAKIAGLGGEAEFFKVDLSGRWFFPLGEILEDRLLLYSFGATIGYGLGTEGPQGRDLPIFERYFPGGINSVRGFDTRELGPTQQVCDPHGVADYPPTHDDDCLDEQIGGSSQIIVNNELIISVLPEAGVKAVFFFDAGNAFVEEDAFKLSEVRYAVGWGVRWLSPFGPLRIEIGYPLDPEEGEDSPVIQFSFGAPL